MLNTKIIYDEETVSKIDEMIEHSEKIRSCINSCKTPSQVESTVNMILTFNEKYKSLGIVTNSFALALNKRAIKKINEFGGIPE